MGSRSRTAAVDSVTPRSRQRARRRRRRSIGQLFNRTHSVRLTALASRITTEDPTRPPRPWTSCIVPPLGERRRPGAGVDPPPCDGGVDARTPGPTAASTGRRRRPARPPTAADGPRPDSTSAGTAITTDTAGAPQALAHAPRPRPAGIRRPQHQQPGQRHSPPAATAGGYRSAGRVGPDDQPALAGHGIGRVGRQSPPGPAAARTTGAAGPRPPVGQRLVDGPPGERPARGQGVQRRQAGGERPPAGNGRRVRQLLQQPAMARDDPHSTVPCSYPVRVEIGWKPRQSETQARQAVC